MAATLWNALAIEDTSLQTDPRIAGLEDARMLLARFRPDAASGELRAFQIVLGERKVTVRTNHQVKGRLTARLVTNQENPRRPNAQLEFTPSADEPSHTANYLVIQWRDEDRTLALVAWDAVSMVVRRLTASQIREKVRVSLPFGGPRKRWAVVEQQVDDKEVVSAYYLEGIERPSASDLALRVLDHLEASSRVGMPSRRSGMDWIPLDEPDPNTGAPKAGRDAGPASREAVVSDDERIDLDRAMRRLSAKSQEIMRRYYQGEPDEAIALSMGLSQQAINKRRLKALARLREMLGD